MNLWGVVPVKRFEAAKMRLSSVLTDGERRELAAGMFDHVLGVLSSCPRIAGIVVVSDSDAVLELAAGRGAVTVRDPKEEADLAAKVDAAVAAAFGQGADAVLVLMSDLPRATPADADDLALELGRSDVVLVADRSGDHTNVLGLRAGLGFRTSFGAPDSFRRHSEAARGRGHSVAFPVNPRLAFDVDTPADLDELRRGPTAPAQAGRS